MGMIFVVGRLTGFVQPRCLIALGAAIIARAMGDRLVERPVPVRSDIEFQQRLSDLTRSLLSRGAGSAADARARAMAAIGRTVRERAAYAADVDVFSVLTIVSDSAVPLAPILRDVKLVGWRLTAGRRLGEEAPCLST